jgi:hypothetical protein
MKKKDSYRDNRYDDYENKDMSKDDYRGRRDPKKNKKRDSERKDRKADNWN